jgi:DNA-binding transcriptional LysR family regulator
MELRQLEYLVAVAEEANFTRAAQRVHISQSGISAQVKELERDLGATLIDRSSRAARLTGAGAAALPHARAALAAAAALRQAVGEVSGLIRGHLVVGMVTACTVPGLFDALALFHGAHPGVAVTLAEDESAALIERVRSGTADLALIGAAGAPPPDLERLIAAAVPGHPLLAGRTEVTLADLAGYPVVCLPAGTGIRATLDACCAAAGVRLDVTLEASAPGSVAGLAARGLGVAVLSESMTAAHGARLRAVPVADAALPAVLALVWKPAPAPAALEFLRCCRQAFTAAAGAADRGRALPAGNPAAAGRR